MMNRTIEDIEDRIIEAVSDKQKAIETLDSLEDELLEILKDPMLSSEEKEKLNNLFEDYLES